MLFALAVSPAAATPVYLSVGDGTAADNANLVIGEVFS
jgi:hypothetical protein